MLQYGSSPLKLLPDDPDCLSVDYASQVMAGLERVLDADQMAVVSDASRPVLLLLADYLPHADGDDIFPVIVLECPVVEKCPE